MAPHDSAAKNKGEYDSCVACYFNPERREDERGRENDDDDDEETRRCARRRDEIGAVAGSRNDVASLFRGTKTETRR